MSSVAELASEGAVADTALIWVEIAAIERLLNERGVAALVGDAPVAVFRVCDEVFAIDHIEPFTGAPVLARGLVGSTGDDVLYVASPLHKQRFCLRTGACLDDPSASVRAWPVRVSDGAVYVASEPVIGP